MNRTLRRLLISIGIGVVIYLVAAFLLVASPVEIGPFLEQFVSGMAGLASAILANWVLPQDGKTGVEPPPARSIRLLVKSGVQTGQEFRLADRAVTIGRANKAKLTFDDKYMSAVHALLEPVEGQWFIEDLKSHNGTYLDNVEVSKRQAVMPGMEIRIGRTYFELKD